MTLRSRFDGALDEWNGSVAQLNDAIANFMNDGLQTDGGTWILTMNQSKSDCLRSARRREELARAALGRIIDTVHQLDDGHLAHQPGAMAGGARPLHLPDGPH